MAIIVNQIGFPLHGAKFAVMGGNENTPFTIKNEETGEQVLHGVFQTGCHELGNYLVGDFSALDREGTYRIYTEWEQSPRITVRRAPYDEPMQAIVRYFSLQRCGNSDTGYHSPCHLDDGIRSDTLRHQDMSGGWHDANDLRKWVSCTMLGLLGLSRLLEAGASWNKGEIEAEIRWGNQYFLNMQDEQGYVMNNCGVEFYTNEGGNCWTDNTADGADDRMIDTAPCGTADQWIFILCQSLVSRLFQEHDRAYADSCLKAARSALQWLDENRKTQTADELGAAVSALVEVYKATGEPNYLDRAAAFADRLLRLQVRRPADSLAQVWGFFMEISPSDLYSGPHEAHDCYLYHEAFFRMNTDISSGVIEPHRSIWRGAWPLTGLCELLEAAPGHDSADAWKVAIALYCDRYLHTMCERTAFGIVPYGLYRNDPGGDKRLGNWHYRWFMESQRSWYVGTNALLASHGIGLAKAGRLLQDDRLLGMAQRQLDWIAGTNPYQTCMIMGFGHHNPQFFIPSRLTPSPPFMKGAVINGISGTHHDEPQLRPGTWQECEYWTPMVCYTLGLMSELQSLR